MAYSDEQTLPVTWWDEKLILLFIWWDEKLIPVGDWTHDLPYTVASNMVNVSDALNHSATEVVNL